MSSEPVRRAINAQKPKAGDLLWVVAEEMSQRDIQDLYEYTLAEVGEDVGLMVTNFDVSIWQVKVADMRKAAFMFFVAEDADADEIEPLRETLEEILPDDMPPFLCTNFALDLQTLSKAELRNLRSAIDELIDSGE